MKKSAILLTLLMCINGAFSQRFIALEGLQPTAEYDNVHVQSLDHDSLASTFVIWVKQSVKAHYHAEHTEVVYVLEGKGRMTLGAEERNLSPGDYVFIPKGTKHSVEVQGDVPMKVISIQSPKFDGSDRIFVNQ